VMLVVSPLALQLTAAAELTVTADGPVMIKSLPFTATELHNIGSAKVSVIDDGVQGGGVTLPIATAACGAIVNWTLLPAVTCLLHKPINVLPSLPVAAFTW
jgi:hypothetical protein